MIMPKSLQNEQSSCSFSRDNSHYEFVLQKHFDYRLEKQTIMLRSVPHADVKKLKNRRKQNFEGGANNMQLDKQDKEDTRRSN